MKKLVVPILAIVAVVGIAQAMYSADKSETAKSHSAKYRTVKAGASTFNSAARYDGNPLRDGKSYDNPLLTLAARYNGDPFHKAHRQSYAYPTMNLAARHNGEPRYGEWAYANPVLHPTANPAARNSGEPGVGEPDTSLTVYLAVRNTRHNGEPRYADLSYANPVLRPSLAAR